MPTNDATPLLIFLAGLLCTLLALLSLLIGSFPAGKSAWLLRNLGRLEGSIIRRREHPALYWFYWSLFAALCVFLLMKPFMLLEKSGISPAQYIESLAP